MTTLRHVLPLSARGGGALGCALGRALARAVTVTVTGLCASACCDEHPRDAVPGKPPDVDCQTGVESGLDIAAWDCIDGKRVVAWRTSSAFLGCSDVRVESGPCGKPTPFEQGLGRDTRCPLLLK